MEVTEFTKQFLKKKLPDIKVGDTVKVHQRIPAFAETVKAKHAAGKTAAKTGKKETEKERIQVFEGIVIAKKHGKGIQGTITVRRIISSIGVEKTFPLHSPLVEKIEIISRGKARRAKLYYLRKKVGKQAKLKKKAYVPGTKAESEESTPQTVISDSPTQ